MKFFLGLLVFLSCSFTVVSQKNIALSGTLLDKTAGEPIIAASVELLNANDSSFISGAISSQEGNFSLKELSKGNYLLHVSYIGYVPVYQKVSLTGNPSVVNTGKILMETDAILLSEAVVEGKKPEVIVKNDTLEYDAASYKTTENAVVEDLLKKLPGVEVDKEGKITVGGKEVKKFLVDGKEFFSDDPQVASKNLPAEMVEKLQVVDRKSEMARMTGFDDGEEETIINLTVKPGMKRGTMGNALVGAGQDVERDKEGRYQAGAFINYMKNNDRLTLIIGGNNNNNMGAGDLGANQFGGMRMRRGSGGGIAQSENLMLNMNKEFSPKLSLNGDIRYNGADRNSLSHVEQSTLSQNQSQLDKTLTENNYVSDNMGINLRLEWKPDSSNTLIFSPNFGYNKSHSDEEEVSARFNYDTRDTIFDSYSTSQNQGEGYNLGANMDFAHKFKKPGRVISVNLRGSLNDSYSEEKSDWKSRRFKEGVYANDSVLDQRMENDNHVYSYRIRASYVEPIGKNNFLQFTYRIAQSKTESINSTYNLYEDDYSTGGTPTDTAEIDVNQSRSTLRNTIEQRYGLSFKSVRKKFNYTVGFNVDPSFSDNETYQPNLESVERLPVFPDDRLPNVIGSTRVSNIEQRVVNFSPEVDFNYIFGERTNLRIDYDGETNQPTPSQLLDIVDVSRPTDLVKGNPNLKPGYTNELRTRFSKYVAATQLFYNLDLNGNLSFNDITSVTLMGDDGIRLTTYENISGNWDAQLRGMFNMPLKNKKFTIGSFGMASFNNRKSYVNEVENTMKNFSILDRLNVNYRSALFDLGINGMINYSDISYTVDPTRNQQTLQWGAGGYTTWYLPHNFTIESDLNWTARSGYAKGFNIPETIWNAAVTKQLVNKKMGTGSLKLQIYDILQDRNSISASSTTNGFRSVETNTIPSFFICSFIYKFTIFPGGSTATKEDLDGGNRGWRGGPGSGSGGGRRF